MKKYRLIDNVIGWLVFVVAAITYLLTIEPTASFWDCPEFIAQAFKSEVGHPPGNPIFILVGRFAANFAGGDVMAVSKCVNAMSALLSAATILFLFWTVTHLVKKLVVKDGEEDGMTLTQYLVVMGSGVCGALVYTWSDTFWFSAVEAEVYAFSSFCTALVVWLMLKWEDQADDPRSDRWIILIAYVFGFSLGVHLLNLLCIPALALIFYYRKWKETTVKGSLITLLVSFAVIVAILYGLEPGFVELGGYFDLLFVNTFGMSYNSGVLFYAFLTLAIFSWAIYEIYKGTNATLMRVSFLLAIVISGMLFIGDNLLIPLVLVIALAVYLFKFMKKVQRRIMANILISSLMIFIGFSCYALIIIRSSANLPLDENSPNTMFALNSYLSRDQYGKTPLLYGPVYTAGSPQYQSNSQGMASTRFKKGAKQWARVVKTSADQPDQYVGTGYAKDPVYPSEMNMLFPRIWSTAHANYYNTYFDTENKPFSETLATIIVDENGNPDTRFNQSQQMLPKPSFFNNIEFFLGYQLNYMYMRYFLWNFAGRQNDVQGLNCEMGDVTRGNWITGFNFLDNARLGDQELLPAEYGKENKGHNVFYCLPLLLGIIGLLWQAFAGKRGIEQFWVVFFLFFMTGIAIVLYLNQTPAQPRERDYAYAGSFYAFAIWVGMGVAGIIRMLRDYCKMKEVPAAALASVLCLLVPIQMAGQTWDDHDRSGRFVARDFGQNYLMTLQEEGNPIIFTNGDNDTFPLWYNQETEGFRTDARTCNLSYLQTDWYIDQIKRPAYDSPSLPITWDRVEYVEGQNEYIPIRPEVKKNIDQMYAQADSALENGNPEAMNELKEQFGENPYELKNILKYWVRSDKEGLRVIPTDSIVMKIDKEAVRRSGMKIPEALGDSIPEYMTILLRDANGNPKRALYKSELMMLEMLANANWERPIYMAITVGSENHLGMDNHFTQEGLAYRFTPFDTDKLNSKIDSEKMYDNLMNKFKFGGIEKPGIYIDENVMRMCYTHRRIFTQLVGQLIKEGKKDKALAALDYAEKMIPSYNVPYDWANGAFQMAEAYYQLGQNEKANKIIDELANKSLEYMIWYLSLTDYQLSIASENFMYNAGLLDAEVRLMEKYKSEELAKHYSEQLDQLYNEYVARMKGK